MVSLHFKTHRRATLQRFVYSEQQHRDRKINKCEKVWHFWDHFRLVASETYSQILWWEGPQASQVSPGGGVVELLNLLHELLLQAPLLLVSLSVCKFHHQRWGTALKQVRDKRHVTHKHPTELKLCIMRRHRHCRFSVGTHTHKKKGRGGGIVYAFGTNLKLLKFL